MGIVRYLRNTAAAPARGPIAAHPVTGCGPWPYPGLPPARETLLYSVPQLMDADK
jgi:hypothetical protein